MANVERDDILRLIAELGAGLTRLLEQFALGQGPPEEGLCP